MSTRTITDGLIANISKGPLLIILMFAIGIWQASKMTHDQTETIKELLVILNTPVGWGGYILSGFLLMYSLLLWPIGKWFADSTEKFLALNQLHVNAQEDHIAASKGMFHQIEDIQTGYEHLRHKIEKYYDGA